MEANLVEDKSMEANLVEDKSMEANLVEDKSMEANLVEDKSMEANLAEDKVTESQKPYLNPLFLSAVEKGLFKYTRRRKTNFLWTVSQDFLPHSVP